VIGGSIPLTSTAAWLGEAGQGLAWPGKASHGDLGPFLFFTSKIMNDKTPVVEISSRISHWRRYKGWSMAEFAKRVGVTPAAAYHWEQTDRTSTDPLQKTLVKILDALEISIGRFYGPLPKISKAKGGV